MASPAAERQTRRTAPGSVKAPAFDPEGVEHLGPDGEVRAYVEDEEKLRHRRGCPEARIEAHRAEGPRIDAAKNRVIVPFRIVRCMDCGEQIEIELGA